jgi:hypothetical protein
MCSCLRTSGMRLACTTRCLIELVKAWEARATCSSLARPNSTKCASAGCQYRCVSLIALRVRGFIIEHVCAGRHQLALTTSEQFGRCILQGLFHCSLKRPQLSELHVHRDMSCASSADDCGLSVCAQASCLLWLQVFSSAENRILAYVVAGCIVAFALFYFVFRRH